MTYSEEPTVQTQNNRGEWVEAIPEPFYVGFRLKKCRCSECGEIFSSTQRYREHYAYAHILGMGSTR